MFWVNDIRKLYNTLVSDSEIKIETQLYDAPWGSTFIVLDPDGNKVEFVQSI